MEHSKYTPAFFNEFGLEHLPAHLGVVVTHVLADEIRAEFQVQRSLLAPNGYLHAGSVVSLADTCTGYGCYANLPDGEIGFTTLELKSNHLGTAREGIVECIAKAVHLGKTTRHLGCHSHKQEFGEDNCDISVHSNDPICKIAPSPSTQFIHDTVISLWTSQSLWRRRGRTFLSV